MEFKRLWCILVFYCGFWHIPACLHWLIRSLKKSQMIWGFCCSDCPRFCWYVGKIGNHCRHLGRVGKIEMLPIACSHKSAKSGTVGKWRNPWLSGIFPDKWKPGLSIDFKSLRWRIFGMRFTWNADSGVAVLADNHNPGWFLQLQLYEFRAWEGGGGGHGRKAWEGGHGRKSYPSWI